MNQEDIETNLLCLLYEKANDRDHFISIEAIASKFVPPQPTQRIESALKKLEKRKLIFGYGANPLMYKITVEGADWVESEYSINLEDDVWKYRRRRAPAKLSDLATGGFNWAKSAAIAAWVIIPVTIVGIFVTIWLDKN